MSKATCPKCGAERVAAAECPQCGIIYAKAEQMAYQRKKDQANQGSSPAGRAPGGWAVDCPACKLEGGMEKKVLPRFPPFIRILGYIIATPSAVGIAFGVVAAAMAIHRDIPGGFFISMGFAGVAAVGGLIGWLLLMRRKAWACQRCGHNIDRV